MTETQPHLRALNINKRFGPVEVLRDVSVEINSGDVISIIGPSGAGKSTTLALLCRFFDPQSGQILIDGQDIRHFRLESLRRNIGVVFQENLLFNRSVEDNLRIGKPQATTQELRQAAIDACALDFIEAMPEQFASPVGERGRFLSGGQRQRLAIARVLLKSPSVVVLDEATSALDAQTESLVQQAMQRVRRGRTTLVIAHRLSTIRHADQIVYMAGGRIVEVGSFDELMGIGGAFAKMVHTQFSGKEIQLG